MEISALDGQFLGNAVRVGRGLRALRTVEDVDNVDSSILTSASEIKGHDSVESDAGAGASAGAAKGFSSR